MNDYDRMSELMGFSPATSYDEEPTEQLPSDEGEDKFSKLDELMGFSPTLAPPTPEGIEKILKGPEETAPLEKRLPDLLGLDKEPYEPTSTMEFEEPTEVKPSEITEKYVPPSPTQSYGTFSVPMAAPSAIPIQNKIAAEAHRGLAAGKQLIAPEIAKTAFLQPTQEKKTERAKTAVELPKEARMHGKAAEMLEPTWYTSEKIQERIDQVRGQDPDLANSFEMGDIVGSAEIALTNAAMSGDEKAINIAYETLNRAKEAAGEFQGKRENRKGFTGTAINTLEAISGMSAMMGRGAALNAIPVVGPVLSRSMWAKQGAGDIIAELKGQGVPNDEALGYGLAGGIAYSLVEGMQAGRVFNTAAKKAIGKSVKSKLIKIAKEKGKDWLENLGEEGLQRIVSENSIINALKASGIEVSRKEMEERYSKAFTEDIKEGALPMLGMSLLGFGAGAGRVAYKRASQRGGPSSQITEMVDEETGEVTPLDGEGTLSAVGITDEEFYELPEEEQSDILRSLLPEEQLRLMGEPAPGGPLTEIYNEETGEITPIGELEQQAKGAMEATQEEADEGMEGETEEADNMESLKEQIVGLKSAEELQPVIDNMTISEVKSVLGELPDVDLTNISQEEADEIIRKTREGIAKKKTGKDQVAGTKYDTQNGNDIADQVEDITFQRVIPGEKTEKGNIKPPKLEFTDQVSGVNFSVDANTATVENVKLALNKKRPRYDTEGNIIPAPLPDVNVTEMSQEEADEVISKTREDVAAKKAQRAKEAEQAQQAEPENLKALREKIKGVKSAEELQPIIDNMTISEVNRVIGKLPEVDLSNISQEQADEIIRKTREGIVKEKTGKAQITGTKYDVQKGEEIAADVGGITFKGIIPGTKGKKGKIIPPQLEFYNPDSKTTFSVNANTATPHSVLIAKNKETLNQKKEAQDGLQRETETKINQTQQVVGEKGQVSVAQKPVPAPISKTQSKETAVDQENITGVSGEERVGEKPVETKPVEATGQKAAPASRNVQAYEKEVKTPKGVTAKTTDVAKNRNLENKKAYELVLDQNKQPTGWIRPKNNKSVLIDPVNRKQIAFKAENPEEATAKAKTNTAASGYAIKNPIIEGAEREPTGKISRETPVSPTKSTEGKAPTETKKKKTEVTSEDKDTEGGKQAPKEEMGQEGKTKFSKKKKETEEVFGEPAGKKGLTSLEIEFTEAVYQDYPNDPAYGALKIVKTSELNSKQKALKKVTEKISGKKIIFFTSDDQTLNKTIGYSFDGVVLGNRVGSFTDTIFVNLYSTAPVRVVINHELWHYLERNPSYKKKFWDAVKLTDKGKADLAKQGESEFAADIVGEMMAEEDFRKYLEKEDKNLFEAIMRELIRIVKRVRNTINEIMTSPEIDRNTQNYKELLANVDEVRDELINIYRDYKTRGKKKRSESESVNRFSKKKEEKKVEKKREEPTIIDRIKEELSYKEAEPTTLANSEKKASKEGLEAEQIYEKQDEDIRKTFHRTVKDKWKDVENFLGWAITDSSHLSNTLLGKGEDAKKVIGDYNATRGYSELAEVKYDDVADKITKIIPRRLERSFARFLQSKRIVEIENVKGEGVVAHTGGMTKQQAQAFIDDINNVFSKKDALAIKTAASLFWKAMRTELNELYENGMLTKDRYERLKKAGKYYSPRQFLQHVDPETVSTGPRGKSISVRDSGLQSLAEGSEKAMVNNWRLLLSDVIIRTQARVYKNKAATSLAEFVEKNPDNLFDGKIEPPAGREMLVIDAEDIVTEKQGELLKLQEKLTKLEKDENASGARIFDTEHQIIKLENQIETWTNRIKTANAKGEDNVFIESAKQPPLPQGKERIYYMEDGEKKAVLVPKDFASSWNMENARIHPAISNVLSFVSGSMFVRPFATGALAIEFMLSNVPRDIAHQYMATTEYSEVPPIALVQNIRNFARVYKDAWTGKGAWREFLQEAGGFEYLTTTSTLLARDPTKLPTALGLKARNIYRGATQLQKFSERLTRLALRQQAIDNGKTPEQASKLARAVLDFSQGGAVIKVIDSIVPYSNVAVQGTRSVVKNAIDNPWRFLRQTAYLASMGAIVALTALKYKEKEWREISEREKVSRWNFPLGFDYVAELGQEHHLIFSIPKDQSTQIFATLGEVGVEAGLGFIDGETAFNRIIMALDVASPIDFIGIFPPTASAWLGYNFNKNFWMKKDMWSGPDVSAYREYYPGKTPKAYIDIAEALHKQKIDFSPERFDQSIQQIIPKTLYSSALGSIYDAVTAGLPNDDRLKLNKKVYDHWSKLPGVRKFVRSTYPSQTDYEKLTEQADEYGIDLKDKDGNKRLESVVKREIREKELELNDLRQQHRNEAIIASEMLLAADDIDDKQSAADAYIALKKRAEEEITGYYKERSYMDADSLKKKVKKDMDRIDKKFEAHMAKFDKDGKFSDLYK